jgi:transposase InsO family protein
MRKECPISTPFEPEASGVGCNGNRDGWNLQQTILIMFCKNPDFSPWYRRNYGCGSHELEPPRSCGRINTDIGENGSQPYPSQLGKQGNQAKCAMPRKNSAAVFKIGERLGDNGLGRVSRRLSPSQSWKTFLENHVKGLVLVDFFTVPTIRFQTLYVFRMMAHDRRRILHFVVTQHPTAEWTAHQLREAFPWDTAPRFLLRNRDRIFGHEFVQQLKAMGIKQVLSTPNAPRQRAYIERLIGTIRRECLDHVIVFNESSLRQHLVAFTEYYHRSRTHLSLQKDTPDRRPVQAVSAGKIVPIPEVGGLHHRYERRAA